MTKRSVLVSVFVFLVAAGLPVTQAQQNSKAPLWGNLLAGPYAVGFKNLYQFDHTRTWRITRGYEKAFAPDLSGRPIRVSVAATAIVDQYRREHPKEIVLDADLCNNLGYRLIGEDRFPEAISIMRLVAYTYPNSANAQDSLADAYIAAGQKVLARAALQEAMKLLPADSSLNEGQKQSLAKAEQQRLDQLKP